MSIQKFRKPNFFGLKFVFIRLVGQEKKKLRLTCFYSGIPNLGCLHLQEIQDVISWCVIVVYFFEWQVIIYPAVNMLRKCYWFADKFNSWNTIWKKAFGGILVCWIWFQDFFENHCLDSIYNAILVWIWIRFSFVSQDKF